MAQLTYQDLQLVLQKLPWTLTQLMRQPEWLGRIFVAGGVIRSVIAGEKISDIDVFASSKDDAELLACRLVNCSPEQLQRPALRATLGVVLTDNAITLTSFEPAIQIIHRWVFESGEAVANSFDFSVCAAALWWGRRDPSLANPEWQSYCDDRFYADVAAHRLIYRAPVRSENAAGSLLRVLKYYQKGYQIPIDHLAAVIGRLMAGYQPTLEFALDEAHITKSVYALLLDKPVKALVNPQPVAYAGTRTKY